MLRSLKELDHYEVMASDGNIGTAKNFLIDDECWTVRYLVVYGGGPLLVDGREVLISPISFGKADTAAKRFDLALTMNTVRNSPRIDLDKPVSRQHEKDFHRYYEYPKYWGYAGRWGTNTHPGMLANGIDEGSSNQVAEKFSGDVHLRSDEELCEYDVQASDGAVGYIEDFIIDDETWAVRYLVVNIRDGQFGKSVLVAPQWASRVSWLKSRVDIDVSSSAINNSPTWDAATPVNRGYEAQLYEYYERPGYWAAPSVSESWV